MKAQKIASQIIAIDHQNKELKDIYHYIKKLEDKILDNSAMH